MLLEGLTIAFNDLLEAVRQSSIFFGICAKYLSIAMTAARMLPHGIITSDRTKSGVLSKSLVVLKLLVA